MSIQMSKLYAYEVCSYRFFDIFTNMKKSRKKVFFDNNLFPKNVANLVDSTKRKENDDIIA